MSKYLNEVWNTEKEVMQAFLEGLQKDIDRQNPEKKIDEENKR